MSSTLAMALLRTLALAVPHQYTPADLSPSRILPVHHSATLTLIWYCKPYPVTLFVLCPTPILALTLIPAPLMRYRPCQHGRIQARKEGYYALRASRSFYALNSYRHTPAQACKEDHVAMHKVTCHVYGTRLLYSHIPIPTWLCIKLHALFVQPTLRGHAISLP